MRVTLLFNSLDQLSSRFPLCAKEPIFIPGIIQMLAGEGVTSFFVAAREEGRSDYYGLDSMAELILEFEHRNFEHKELVAHLSNNAAFAKLRDDCSDTKLKPHATKRAVVVAVGRYAGGQAAGSEGILEFIDRDDPGEKDDLNFANRYKTDDLIFIPRNTNLTGPFGKMI